MKTSRIIFEQENEKGVKEKFIFESEYSDGFAIGEDVINIIYRILLMAGFDYLEKKQIKIEDRDD